MMLRDQQSDQVPTKKENEQPAQWKCLAMDSYNKVPNIFVLIQNPTSLQCQRAFARENIDLKLTLNNNSAYIESKS